MPPERRRHGTHRVRSERDRGNSASGAAIRDPISFHDFELGTELRSRGALVDIAPKPFAILCHLVRHRDRVVPKSELLEKLWPDVSVSDAALSSALKDLRRALGDTGSRQQIIRTVRGRGLRFAAPVRTEGKSQSVRELPFVGRRRELRHLVDCAGAVMRGQPQVAAVIGEPGAGKTRLVEELTRHRSCSEFAVATGYCEAGTARPYLPFVQVLRALHLEMGDHTAQHAHDDDLPLQRLLRPQLPQSRRSATSRREEAARERSALFSSIWRTIVQAAQRRPVLIVIEDLHHADAATLDLLASLAADISDAQHSEAAAAYLVATTQPPSSGSRLAVALRRILSQRRSSSVALSGLGVRATADLLSALGIARPGSPDSRAVRGLTGGNPLFIRDLLRDAERSELLADSAPENLRAAMTRRIAQLGSETLEVLSVAAFIGDRFGLSALCAAVGQSAEVITARLRSAIEAGILAGDDRSFRFENPLMREVLQASTPPERRRDIHRSLAAVLEDLYASDERDHAMEIARHLIEAGDLVEPDRLIVYATRAGDQAFALCAWEDALSYYDAALAIPARFSHAERAELHLRMGVAADHSAQLERAVDCFERAARDYRQVGDDIGAAWAAMYSARTAMRNAGTGSQPAFDPRPLEELVRQLGESEAGLRGRLLVTIAEGASAVGQVAHGTDVAKEALALGQRIGDEVLCHDASMAVALARYTQLQLHDALGSWLDAAAYARRSRDPWVTTAADARIVLAMICIGRFDEARNRVADAQTLFHRDHNPAAFTHLLAQKAVLELATGQLDDAEEAAAVALAHVARSRHPWAGSVAWIVRASAAAQRGDWREAEGATAALLEPAQAFATDGASAQFLASTYRMLLRAYRSRSEIARDALAELVERVPRVSVSGDLLSPICALVEIALEANADEERRALQSILETAFERGYAFTGAWVFLVPRLLGRCAFADGRFEAAEEWFDRAIRIASASGARAELARANLDRAVLRARRAGRRASDGGAAADAAAAMTLARALGMRPLEQRARRLAS